MENVKLEIITPEKNFFSDESFMIILPGSDGDIGILSQHIELFTLLRPGLVKIYSSETEIKRKIFVYGGFAEIANDKVAILADNAIYPEEIDKTAIEKELEQTKIDLQASTTDVERNFLLKEALIKESMLEIASGKVF